MNQLLTNMNDFIVAHMPHFSALAILLTVVFIAWILHKSVQRKEVQLIQHDFVSLMQRISAANTYKAISDLEHEIEQFDYQHNHEVGCAHKLLKLTEAYGNKRHDILVDISKIANQEVNEVQRTDFIIAN